MGSPGKDEGGSGGRRPIFLAAQAPELVSRDLRSHVLPLYFSRPIRRGDYPLAKYVALTAALLLLIEVPLLITYVGTISSARSGHGVWEETKALIPGLGVGLMWAVPMAAVGLVLASLTGRRAYATGIVAIACFLTWTVSELLIQSEGGPTSTSTGARIGGLFSPFNILDGSGSGSAARRRVKTLIQATSARSTGSWRSSCSRPASGAWPRDTGK